MEHKTANKETNKFQLQSSWPIGTFAAMFKLHYKLEMFAAQCALAMLQIQ